MRRGARVVVTALLALSVALALAGCGGGEDTGGSTLTASPQPTGSPESTGSSASASTTPTTTPSGRSSTAARPRVVATIARNLEVPWGLAFLPDGTALVTERDSARVLALRKGSEPREVARLEQAAPQGESGLLGIAVSPDFEENRRVYLYLTTPSDNRVVRATFDGDRLRVRRPILTGIPKGFIHDGGRMVFGPEGHLFVATGETGEPELAQDLDSLAGKILRIDENGDPAPGNPDPSSPVYSYGHRNVQGLAFDDDGNLWATEFGSDAWDELNRIEPGGNYGWPMVEGRSDREGLVDPQVVWRTDVASPSGLAFLDGHLWLGALQGERLWRVRVTDGRAGRPTDLFVGDYGRMRSVEVSPEGTLWVTTSNRDGRGQPEPADDRILEVTPG